MSDTPTIEIVAEDGVNAAITVKVSPLTAIHRVEEDLQSQRPSLIECEADPVTGDIVIRHVGRWMIWTPQKRMDSLKSVVDSLNAKYREESSSSQ